MNISMSNNYIQLGFKALINLYMIKTYNMLNLYRFRCINEGNHRGMVTMILDLFCALIVENFGGYLVDEVSLESCIFN
jgi:hypothetical protein